MARDKGRERRDAAGVGPDPADARRRLIPIEDLKGYTLAAGEPDIRGWDVRTLGGRDLGEVEDLLVDPDRGEVVMLEVDLRGDASNRHAEVPIRSVQLDRARRCVLVDSGDLVSQNDLRARDRVDPAERDRLGDRPEDANRDVRFGAFDDARGESVVRREDGSEEVVVERRPVVEEVVVRRRIVETNSDDRA
jgi:sporulation protein YlmC with PRC-barrel domain